MSAPPDAALSADPADEWSAAATSRSEDRSSGEVEDWAEDGASNPDMEGRAAANEVFPLVYRQMRGLVGGRPDFDDLVQTAAEQVLRSFASFEGRCKLSTWCYRICYLTLLRHERWYRRWLRRFTLAEGGDLEQHASAVEEPMAEELERITRLRRAVARLSPKRRTVVVLHDLEGHSIGEIAGIVAANPLTVRSRLRDGRRDLARILGADPYFGDEACRPEETEV